MYEIFVMSLRDFWNEDGELSETEATESVKAFQNMLSEHYGKPVRWEESVQDSDDIVLDAIHGEDLMILQALAAKLELSGNLDGLELDYSDPWDCSVFEELQAHIDADKEIKHFESILTLNGSPDALVLPVDLPTTITVDLCEDDEAHDEDECEASIDVLSQPALRRELDKVAEALEIDLNAKPEDSDTDNEFEAFKMGLRALSDQLNDAIDRKLPLVLSLVDSDEEDYEEEDEDEQ